MKFSKYKPFKARGWVRLPGGGGNEAGSNNRILPQISIYQPQKRDTTADYINVHLLVTSAF